MASTSTVVEQDRDLFLIQRGPRHFEVWRIQRRHGAVLRHGTEFTEGWGWRPPKTSEWGKHGWSWCCTPRSERLARQQFAHLVRSRSRVKPGSRVPKRGAKGGVLEPAKGPVAPPP